MNEGMTYIYIHTYIHIYEWMNDLYIYTHTYTYINEWMTYIYTHAYTYMNEWLIYTHTYINGYAHTYTYTCMNVGSLLTHSSILTVSFSNRKKSIGLDPLVSLIVLEKMDLHPDTQHWSSMF